MRSLDDDCLWAQARWLGKIHELLHSGTNRDEDAPRILQTCVDRYFYRRLPTQRMIEHCVRVTTRSRRRKQESSGDQPVPINIECHGRRRCEDMHSPVEAMFHYSHCGLEHLDVDRDGKPCEAQFQY